MEKGQDKIREICNILKNETLTPAKEEAQKIIQVAEQEARNIIRDAETKAELLLQTAQKKQQKEREFFESSMRSACKQGIEALKQDIEKKLFNDQMADWLKEHVAQPKVSAQLLQAIVDGLKADGVEADFSAYIPKQVSKDEVNALLAQGVLKKLKEQSVVVGEFLGGVQLKLHKNQLTLDLSDDALKDLVGRYIRKDFRSLLFHDGSGE